MKGTCALLLVLNANSDVDVVADVAVDVDFSSAASFLPRGCVCVCVCVCPHVGRQNFRFHSVAFVFPLLELEQLLLLKAGVEATTTSALTATPATAPASTLTCWLCPANFSFSRPVFLATKKITAVTTRTTTPTATTTAADAQKKRLKKPCENVARDNFLGRREKDASNSRITKDNDSTRELKCCTGYR